MLNMEINIMNDLFEFLGFQDAMRKTEGEKTWYDKAMDIANADNDSFFSTNYISNILDDED